jgi:hypothetical protein
MFRRLFLSGVIMVWGLGAGGSALQSGKPSSWVQERIRDFRTAPAMKWTTIPWVGSLVEARRLSREDGRPVLLFTHDGNIETGRC